MALINEVKKKKKGLTQEWRSDSEEDSVHRGSK